MALSVNTKRGAEAMEDSKILYEKTVLGEPASKSNNSRIIRRGRHVSLIKSEKAMNYSSDFRLQVPILQALLLGDLRVDMNILYANRRSDLDDSLILDLMQGRVYVNDRQVKQRNIFWGLDKLNPRTLIRIYRMDHVSNPFKDIEVYDSVVSLTNKSTSSL